MINIKNVSKKFGNHYAVKNLNLDLGSGRIYGFLGPNGAGKTTTMNMITGYLAATEGTITVNGFDIIKNAEEAKACIGYLPENPPLYPDMTVLEYLNTVAELKHIPKAKRKTVVLDVMKKVDVVDMSNRLTKNLSKGYRQRVGLAQALIGNPEILILDEPTVGLDPKQILEMRELITSLKEHRTIILSSHIMQEVQAVCDYILIISKGKLVAQGTPEELIEQQASSTTASITVEGPKEEIESLYNSLKDSEKFKVKFEQSNIEDVFLALTKGNELRDKIDSDREEAEAIENEKKKNTSLFSFFKKDDELDNEIDDIAREEDVQTETSDFKEDGNVSNI